jgi:hypothetical protein
MLATLQSRHRVDRGRRAGQAQNLLEGACRRRWFWMGVHSDLLQPPISRARPGRIFPQRAALELSSLEIAA